MIRVLEKPSPLSSLTDDLEISVILHTSSTPEEIIIEGLAPFHTIEDLARAIYVQTESDEVFPKYSLLCIKTESGISPAMGTWFQENQDIIQLLDPITTIQDKQLQDSFVDIKGQKMPVSFTPRGRVTLEQAFPIIPQFHVYSFEYLMSLYSGQKPISQQEWLGLFYPYFPQLNSESTEMTQPDVKFSEQMKRYIETKKNDIRILNILLETVSLQDLRTTSVKYLSFQWDETIDGFEGADSLFYSAPVNDQRPYMRLLTPNTVPLTKLYQPDPLAPPFVHDVTLLKTWIQDRAPISTENCLYVKVLLRNESTGVPPLFGTLLLMDTANANFVIQPPKEIRNMDFRADLFQLGEVLTEVAIDMPFYLDQVKLGKATLTVELEFDTLPPKDIRKQVAKRLDSLGSIFQHISVPEGQQKPLFMLRYKGVSNFVKEDTISEYLSYYFGRKGMEDLQKYVPDVARQFEISEDEALKHISDYIERKEAMTIADPEAKEYVSLMNTGTDISIVSQNVNTFSFTMYNLKSTIDLQRICSILSVVFLGDEEQWDDVLDTSKIVEQEEEIEEVILNSSLQQEDMISSKVPIDAATAALLQDFGEEDEEEINQALAPKPTQAKLQTQTQAKEEPEQKIIAHQWFIKQLQKIDSRLFNYPKTTGVKHYSSQCAANEDRYPAILTQAQYTRMKTIYSDEKYKNRVAFIIYGDSSTADSIKDAKGVLEQITVLRYGSDSGNPNYFLCSEYFCLRDLLPVLKDDWEELGHCPFCNGKLILDPKNPGENEYVYHRKNKPKSTKRHLFVGFLKDGKHPGGLDLPCCFVKEKHLGWTDPRFKSLRDAPKTRGERVGDEKSAQDLEKERRLQEGLQVRVQQLVSYDILRSSIHRQYVLGPEKYPLEPGKIGMANIAIDNYFLQDSSTFVARSAIKQEFKPNAQGIFRLGVANRITILNQSLFAALSPMLGKNTVQEVVRHFSDLITPRIFINLNFGNLLLEFFNPSDPEPTSSELASWALVHLQVSKPGTEFELSRFYRSYMAFKDYIKDPTKKKQLRHFVHALAEPNLLAPRGITIMTLEYQGDPREPTTSIKVNCPSLGYDSERYSSNMLGLLTYHSSGIWEPLVYIDRITKKDTAPMQLEGQYVIPHEDVISPDFPQGIRDRYLEFVTKCRSTYRGAFTYQSGVDNRSLLPVTRALEILNASALPTGIVRDSYNHLVAITVLGESGDILVPVVDDGNSFNNNTALHIHVGLQSIELANAKDVEDLYTEIITPQLGAISNIYTINTFLRNEVGVFGYRLVGNINLPCEDSDEVQAEEIDNFQFEYEINRAILVGEDDKYPESKLLLQKNMIEDIYQHLRLSFSTWIAVSNESSTLRETIKKLIERRDIPAFEKIRRLQIELEPLLIGWLAPDPNPFTPEPVFLRSDCASIQDPDKCTGYCTMDNSICKLHVPETILIGEKTLNTSRFLILRLFDEIIRIPAKAQELLEKGVKRVQVPTTNIRIKDQWIIPENVPAWYTLLRDSSSVQEQAQYYEEFSRNFKPDEQVSQVQLVELPENLKAILPAESVSGLALRVVGPLLNYFGMEDEEITPEVLTQIAKKYNVPAVLISINQDPIVPIGRSKALFNLKDSCLVLVPDLEEGPALLVTRDTMNEFVPGEMLKGPILDSIQRGKVIIRRAETVKPATVTRTVLKQPTGLE